MLYPLTNVQRIVIAKGSKFAVVGSAAFIIDAGGYYILTRDLRLPYLLARTLSMVSALLANFLLNRYWTFEASEGKLRPQIERFSIVMLVTSLLNLGMMKIGVAYLHLPDMVVLVSAAAIVMAINFVAHYWWSFKAE